MNYEPLCIALHTFDEFFYKTLIIPGEGLDGGAKFLDLFEGSLPVSGPTCLSHSLLALLYNGIVIRYRSRWVADPWSDCSICRGKNKIVDKYDLSQMFF